MENGTIVEYIDQQRIFCGVILETADQRVRLLTEENREVNQRISRLSHVSRTRLNIGRGRDNLVAALKETAVRRKCLSSDIDIKELWEVLSPVGEWVDLATMTGLCFPNNPNGDHESAVIRACFENRIYFKFNHDAFFPHNEDQVQQNIETEKEKERRRQLIENGGQWLKSVLEGAVATVAEDQQPVVEMLKSYYLFGKDSPDAAAGRTLLAGAGIENVEKIFDLLVKVGVWTPNQLVDLQRYHIPVDFSEAILKKAEEISDRVDFKALDPCREI